MRRLLLLTMAACTLGEATASETEPPKRIVIIAGKKSHGPEGNGIHDYNWSARLLKVMLDHSNVRDAVHVVVHTNGWPEQTASLSQADSIMIISDGRDGDKFEEALHLATPERVRFVSEQMDRGCGLVLLHFSTFAPDRLAEQVFDWVGGYFDWETEGRREWYSAIQVADTELTLPTPQHAVCRGVEPFSLRDEFYFNLRFRPVDPGLIPIAAVPALPGRDAQGKVVAWARERRGGGRGFATTCGHFYDNWKQPAFRKLMLNGLAWSAGVDVPQSGVSARFYSHDEITAAFANVDKTGAAKLDEEPIHTLIIAGNEAHRWHNWEKTTPAIKQLLERDPRAKVEVTTEIEELGRRPLARYGTIILNYANWQDPTQLSEAAKRALVLYLKRGGGLIVVHFANGAFHYSLPMAGASDWPEYRQIIRRVWDHEGEGESQSGHDPFGPFTIQVTDHRHPITAGLGGFDVTDELYFRQAGDQPIIPLITARSQVTGNDEPLAFAYRYGDGRVFQTLLGHSERTYETFEAREMLRRALAWTAGRPVHPLKPSSDPPPRPTLPEPKDPLIAGRFGKGLDARVATAIGSATALLRDRPLTIDFWVRLDDKKSFNILFASEPKSSPHHFELFTEAGSGRLALYMPGQQPDHARTRTDLVDGRWHHVAALMEKSRVQLFVDGKRVADQKIAGEPRSNSPHGFAVGGLVEGGLGCDGCVDEVRIRMGIHPVDTLPKEPPRGDALALWRFDKVDDSDTLPSAVGKLPPLKLRPADQSVSEKEDHFGEEAVGFRWQEEDSRDGRWNETQIGPFLASTLFLREGEPIGKGLSVRVGLNLAATLCYDTATASLRGGWTGGFLRFDSTRHGLITPPRVAGSLAFVTEQSGEGRYHALHRHDKRVVLSCSVDGQPYWEHPWADRIGNMTIFSRTFRIGPSSNSVWIPVGKYSGESRTIEVDGLRAVTFEQDGTRVVLFSKGKASLEVKTDGSASLRFAGGPTPREATLLLAAVPEDDLPASVNVMNSITPTVLAPLLEPGGRLWPEEPMTQRQDSRDDAPYVVDALPLPVANPYGALCFASGHDFLPNGDLAVAMVHGDVWIVRGADKPDGVLRWTRFATGLYQPLGLKVIDGEIYVLGRDQITRLVDSNGDGEADRYEVFCNDYETSPGGHDYVTCLQTDDQNRFYFLHATKGLLRVDAEGRRAETIATGFRNPNGLGVGPDGTIMVAPQEGTWTPSSALIRVRPGGYYGFPQFVDKAAAAGPVDPPLCWIPRLIDNSSGGQVWAPSKDWGPLAGRLLHCSYGQCQLMLVLAEQVGDIWQGGVVPLPWQFRSGVMRGRVSPRDDQLYVSGLRGWTSSAVDDGCLCRVRYTGKPMNLPIGVATKRNGLAVTFSEPLDRAKAQDADRYAVHAWNYRRTAEYGSDEWSVASPNQTGRDEWEVRSATLLDDSRTVFLELPDIKPAMQVLIESDLTNSDKQPSRHQVAYTIHRVPENAMDESKLVRSRRAGQLSDDVAQHLAPGVLARFSGEDGEDALRLRQLAWRGIHGAGPTVRLPSPAFRADLSGYLKAPETGDYTFRAEASGHVTLWVNETVAFDSSTTKDMMRMRLHKGYNQLRLVFEPSVSGTPHFRVRWSSERFAEETVPATLLFHDARDETLVTSQQWREGSRLYIEHRCNRCHQAVTSDPQDLLAPDLAGLGERVTSDWLVRWLADPVTHRPQATMPHCFDLDVEVDRQALADVVAFLQAKPAPKTSAGVRKRAKVGGQLYEELSCYACHVLEEVADDPFNRVPLDRVGQKYQTQQLTRFLREPSRHYPATRMPDFSLTDEEALALAEYLRESSEEGEAIRLPEGNSRAGRQAFLERGCAQCHTLHGVSAEEIDVPIEQADSGCLAGRRRHEARGPAYAFTASQRAALANYLQNIEEDRGQLSPVENSLVVTQRLNCAACHDRGGGRSPRLEIYQEESASGLAPERLPNLTWAGEKLHAPWMRKLFAGELAYRSRPWMKARMPAWPTSADRLAEGLAAEHGITETVDEKLEVDADQVALGRRLVGLKTGLDCRQCHAIGSLAAVGDDQTKLAPGVNLVHVKDRLRREFYHVWMLDPPRFDIATRMPKLSQDGRKTKLTGVFDGDARRQFDAIWHYIQSLEGTSLKASSP